MKVSKICIVLPVYNVEQYIDEFFQKLLSQTFQDFSVICVYDLSTDKTYEILETYADKYKKKITILCKEKKEGLGAARDYALDSGLIQSEFITFLDPDDYPEPDYLEKMIQAAERTKADITVCGFYRFDSETGKVYSKEMVNNPVQFLENTTGDDTLAYMNPAVWNKLYRYELIKDVRFTKAKRAEDILYLMRIIPSIKSVYFINECLYHYRVRYDSLSNTISEKDLDEFLNNFNEIVTSYEDYPDKDTFMPLLELMGFIHIGIAFNYRLSEKKDIRINKTICKTKQFLDDNLPGWRYNRYLSFRYLLGKKGFKGLGLWGCRFLYKTGMFVVFLKLYNFMINTLKIDIKW